MALCRQVKTRYFGNRLHLHLITKLIQNKKKQYLYIVGYTIYTSQYTSRINQNFKRGFRSSRTRRYDRKSKKSMKNNINSGQREVILQS